MIARNLTRDCILGERVERAATGREVRRGLLAHDELPPGGGLWLCPCGSVHTFFMKFAIDVVYLSRELRVLKIVPVMWPWNVSFAPWSAYSVLELPPGVCRESNTQVGDRIQIGTV